jgi:hypothetical protein
LKKAEKDLLFSKLSPHSFCGDTYFSSKSLEVTPNERNSSGMESAITNLIVGVFVKQLTLCSSDRKLETADHFDYTLGVEYGNGLSSIEKCTRIFMDGNKPGS